MPSVPNYARANQHKGEWMSWLLFMDESGHDHRNMPLEVRGGIALHSSRIWDFTKEFQDCERKAFGFLLAEKGKELKGSKLLEVKHFKNAGQEEDLDDNARQKGVARFISKSQQKVAPSKREFTAYGQANLLLADMTFRLLQKHEAVLFASAIPKRIKPPHNFQFDHFLRKDHVFLQQRFYWFLEAKQENGLFVMDQTEKQLDRRYLRRLHGITQRQIKAAKGQNG